MNLAVIRSLLLSRHLMLRLMDEPLEGLLQGAVFAPSLSSLLPKLLSYSSNWVRKSPQTSPSERGFWLKPEGCKCSTRTLSPITPWNLVALPTFVLFDWMFRVIHTEKALESISEMLKVFYFQHSSDTCSVWKDRHIPFSWFTLAHPYISSLLGPTTHSQSWNGMEY